MCPIQFEVFGCLLVGKIFLSKVKGMSDRGIMRTFHICARILPTIEIKRYCRNGVCPIQYKFFFLNLRWERLNSGAGHYVNYQNIKKREVISFSSPFNVNVET